MEIIKISLSLFLFFYLTWMQLFYLMLFGSVYYYNKRNTIYLIENQSLTNNLLYGVITLGNFAEEQIYKLWNYSKTIRYINTVPLYIENINNNYLYYKRKTTVFILMKSGKYVFRLMGVGKEPVKVKKTRNLKNLNSKEDINIFLDKLRKTPNDSDKKHELANLVDKLVKND